MGLHVLKTWPDPFQAAVDGKKPYEIRKNDRNYQVGDLVDRQEWDPKLRQYTGREMLHRITYLTPGGDWGLPADLCVFALEPVVDVDGNERGGKVLKLSAVKP